MGDDLDFRHMKQRCDREFSKVENKMCVSWGTVQTSVCRSAGSEEHP